MVNDYFKDTFSKVASALENKTMYHNENMPADIENYPKYLYKYKNGLKNHDFTMIEEEYLWANFANGFDDPTDSFVNLSVEVGGKDKMVDMLIDNYGSIISHAIATGNIKPELFPNMTQVELLKYKKSITTQNGKYSATQNQKLINQSKDKQLKKINSLIRSQDFKKGFEEQLETGLERIVQFLRANCTICSLTSRKDNQKLWEDFAGKYSGFVIEYDTRKCIGNVDAETGLSNTFKVTYRKNLPKVSLYSIFEWWFLTTVCGQKYDATKLTEDIYRQLFLKKKEYAGEEEWRLIAKQNRISFPVVSAVYMGYKIDTENEDKLKQICFEKGIPLYKQRFAKYSTKMFFDLVREEVLVNA